MPANNEFTFSISVSQQNFSNKLKSNDCAWKSIIFTPQRITIGSLLQAALNGKVFCGVFKSSNPDSSFQICEKTKENFIATQIILFDFDNMNEKMDEFITNTIYKPSFGYTTYDNGADGCGYRFRLGYVFKYPICGVADFNAMYNAIFKANEFQLESREQGGVDRKTFERCDMCYLGTTPDADTYYTSYSSYIYTCHDFEEFIESSHLQQDETGDKEEDVKIDSSFLNDFLHLSSDDFFHKYCCLYSNYKQSLETPLILDESQWFYTFPDSYVAVRHKKNGGRTLRWNIGEGRKTKMFITAKIMLHNNPALSIENILFNLRMERKWFYVNTDDKLSNEVLIRIAKNAFIYDCTLNPTEHPAYRVNKPFWAAQGISANSAKGYVRFYLHAMKIKPYINSYMPLEYNLKLLNDNGIKISKTTLNRMVTKGFIELNNKKMEYSNTYLSECRSSVTNPVTKEILNLIIEDGTRTQSQIAEILCMDIRSVKRYFREMQGKLIVRDGNNRTGKWVVIEHQQEPNVLNPQLGAEQTFLS